MEKEIEATAFALVLAHNAGEDLGDCLRHLSQYFPPERIIVGDNASSDDSFSQLVEGVRVERFKCNIGYCAGMNRLMRTALSLGAKTILSINPDARINAEDVFILLDVLRGKDVAVVHPKISLMNNRDILDGAYGEITWRHFAVRMCGEGVADKRFRPGQQDVVSGHGACFVARPDILLNIGGFDESFFAYQEEADLGLRLRRAGWRIVYVPGAEAVHRGPWNDANKMQKKMYYLARNSALLVRKHATAAQRMKFLLFLFIGGGYHAMRALFGNELSRSALRGWRDGFLFRRIAEAGGQG